MNIQKNARLTPLGRERMVRVRLVEQGQTPEAVARAVRDPAAPRSAEANWGAD